MAGGGRTVKFSITIPGRAVVKGRPRLASICGHAVAYTPKKEPPVSEFIGNYLFSPDYPQARCHAEGTKLVCSNDRRHDGHDDDGRHDEAQR